jgi:hypothetical protein
MKKILIALALAAFASTSYAAVENSKHDFNFQGSYSTSKASRCQYCHVPHHSATWADTALWAISEPDTSGYSLWTTVGTLDPARSVTCLACHGDATTPPLELDGTTQVLGQAMATSAVLGPDLTNDHPIGSAFMVEPGAHGIKDVPEIKIGRATITKATSSTWRSVECALCHSVHGQSTYTIAGKKLLYGPGNSGVATGWDPLTVDFCNICHSR